MTKINKVTILGGKILFWGGKIPLLLRVFYPASHLIRANGGGGLQENVLPVLAVEETSSAPVPSRVPA